MTKTAHLENWHLSQYYGETVLVGEVFKHRRIEDGHRIITSRILNVNLTEKVARTFYTLYTLGTPSDKHRDVIPKELEKLENNKPYKKSDDSIC